MNVEHANERSNFLCNFIKEHFDNLQNIAHIITKFISTFKLFAIFDIYSMLYLLR